MAIIRIATLLCDDRRPERSPEGPAVLPRVIFNFTTHREKVKILSKKVRDTQANPSYSAKNNVAIRMIATFMPKPSMFNLLFLKSFNLLTGNINIILQLRALFVITVSEYLTYLIMDQTVEFFS